MAFGTDYTPVGPMPTDIVLGDVDATSMRLARDIRDKGHGIDTRETMARMILKSSTMHNHLIKVNNALKVQNDEYYRQFTDVLKELSEDKDYHSLPEIAGARNGFDTLGERLDDTAANFNRKIGELGTTATFKGSATNAEILAKTGMEIGDEWFDTTNNSSLRWNGSSWIEVGGSIALGEGAVNTRNYSDRSVTAEKTNFINYEYGDNLFNKNEAQLGRFISGGATVVDLPGYFATPKIKSNSESNYTIYPVRHYRIFDKNGLFLSEENTSNNLAQRTITVPAGGSFDFSGREENLDITQVNIGDSRLPYSEFSKKLTIPNLEIQQSQVEKIDEGEKLGEDEIAVVKDNQTFILKSLLGDKEIEIHTNRTGSLNNSFSYTGRTLYDGLGIHVIGDDITPIRTFATVGANHGYTNILVITMSGHGKTTVDLGSVWTDGVTDYTLLKITGDELILGCPYLVDSEGRVTSPRVLPTANLSHVRNATNTSAISTSAISNGQLYPSINKIKSEYYLDGNLITKDGTSYGKKLRIADKYTVMDYKSIIDMAQANVGTPYQNLNIEGVVEVSNAYTFTKGLKCTTTHALRILKNVTLGRTGFLQSLNLDLSGYKTVRTMPFVNALNFETGQDLTGYTSNILINQSNIKSGVNPPSHYVDWLVNGSNQRFIGFSMGYIVDKTDTESSKRTTSPNYWDLRGSKKSYPVAFESMDAYAGDYFSAQGFRQYLVPTSQNHTEFSVSDDKSTYVYIDYHSAQNHVSYDVGNTGSDITVLQSDNFTQVNHVTDANGLVYKSSGSGGAVIKLE